MTEKHPGGRPTDYTPVIALAICERIMEGQTLRQIEADEDMPAKGTILRWLSRHPEFQDQYARAHQIQAEHDMDEIREISDANDDDVFFKQVETEHGADAKAIFNKARIERDRLRIQTRQWTIERKYPSKYGPKQETLHRYPDPLVIKGSDGKVIETLGSESK